MSKFEDDMMELINTMTENNHHNVAKPFRRGAKPKGQLTDAKSIGTCMLLEKDGEGLEPSIGSAPHPQQF